MKENIIPEKYLNSECLILDVGGWAKPLKKATHVVDLFPWETRGYGLNLAKLPNERFSKDSWYQIDFLQENLTLPFEKNKFEFSVCSHTLEDLVNPEPIISEIIRVSKGGYIETPSRLNEQTIGVRDGKSDSPGHPHHYWIVEEEDGVLRFFNKSDSMGEGVLRAGIPYRSWRNMDNKRNTMSFFWNEQFKSKFITGNEAAQRAIKFKSRINLDKKDILIDYVKRRLRYIRDRLVMKGQVMENWNEIVERSKMYSKVNLD